MSAHLKIEFHGGDSIEFACQEAINLAGRIGIMVTFDLNGVHVMARAGDDATELADAWMAEMKSDHTYKVVCLKERSNG